MNEKDNNSKDADAPLESLGLDLIKAAYPVALIYGMEGLWLDLELDLWREISQIVDVWQEQLSSIRTPGDFDAWRTGLLVNVTESASRVLGRYGVHSPSAELEKDLFRAFRSEIGRANWESVQWHSWGARAVIPPMTTQPNRCPTQGCGAK